jgi:hypothetical protein
VSALARLGRFVRGREAEERCGLCAASLGPVHPHLVQVESGRLHCSCAGCASVLGPASGKFRRVPERVRALADLRMTPEDWQGFAIPVGIAFFVRSTSRGGAVVFYPSPLGPVETAVPAEAWEGLLGKNPGLGALEPDVEAVLIRRGVERSDAFLVPLDECYRLTALVRQSWRGFTGGEALTGVVDEFFAGLGRRSGGDA